MVIALEDVRAMQDVHSTQYSRQSLPVIQISSYSAHTF